MNVLKGSAAVAGLAVSLILTVTPQATAEKPSRLFGTTGACNNATPGAPCTQRSTLVELDPRTGALVREIGPVGYTVNGLAWDRSSKRLYASTAIGDVTFHGLITIDPQTGAGTPVNASVGNFGLAGPASPIHSITLDSRGNMAAWYDEFPPPLTVTDTYVTIDPHTGIASEHPNTGINTSQNGLSFDEDDRLWNIDAPSSKSIGAPPTQTAYQLRPTDGTVLRGVPIATPTPAALGDFSPDTGLYYGLEFEPFSATKATFIEAVNVRTGTLTTLGQTVDDLHTLAFAKKVK
ncbi:MAG: hypothetical protein ACKOVB_22815 [Terrabacter sp.]